MTDGDSPAGSATVRRDEDGPPAGPRADRELLGSWDRASRDRVLFLLCLVGLTAIVVSAPVNFSAPTLLQVGVAALVGVAGVLFPSRLREHASRWFALGFFGILVGLEYLARPEDVGYLVGFLALVLAGVLSSAIARRSTP
jgi:hypothetical protein